MINHPIRIDSYTNSIGKGNYGNGGKNTESWQRSAIESGDRPNCDDLFKDAAERPTLDTGDAAIRERRRAAFTVGCRHGGAPRSVEVLADGDRSRPPVGPPAPSSDDTRCRRVVFPAAARGGRPRRRSPGGKKNPSGRIAAARRFAPPAIVHPRVARNDALLCGLVGRCPRAGNDRFRRRRRRCHRCSWRHPSNRRRMSLHRPCFGLLLVTRRFQRSW